MVAISLYRGNLHRIPGDVARRWLMPTPSISIKDFRSLLCRRSKALSLLPSASSLSTATITVVSNPKPNLNLNPPPNNNNLRLENLCPKPSFDVEINMDQPLLLVDEDDKTLPQKKDKEKAKADKAAPLTPALKDNDKKIVDAIDEKGKRKREVEEKLHILNEKKHNLVQALKQILNAEEELKRRSSMQAGRPPLPLQVDASNDSGSMTRHATPRAGSEANVTVDMEGGEGDDAININPQCRPLLRMSSTSPSAESALRRQPYFQYNVAPHPSRAALVAAGSPWRFAPSCNQSHPSNLPTVSVSGTNYFASSPSPAASGGTSVFRDARHPSPWN